MSRTAIRNATAVCVDALDTIVDKATIVIDDGVITEITPGVKGAAGVEGAAGIGGGMAGGAPRGEPDVEIDADGGIVLPGLFNAHAHLAMTLLRGVADDCDLDGFLAAVLPIEGALLSAHVVEVGTELAAVECLRSGITSALDMYFFPEEALTASAAMGMRLHTGPVFIQFPGADNRPWDVRLAWAREWMAGAAAGSPGAEDPRSRWACPHSTYLLTERQLRDVAALSNETQCRVHVHAAETRAELAQVAGLHGGRTPVQVLFDTGLLHDRTVLAHCVHVTDVDIALIADAGAHVVHNPASNAKLASGLAPVRRMLDAGINVALGTDGSASANDLDLWLAMRLAGFLPSLVHDHPGQITARELLRMATINGARAAGVDDFVGSLEVGKRADLIVLDSTSAASFPSYDPLSTLAYATSRAEVRDVFVDGSRVVVEGSVVHQAADLRRRVGAIAERVRALASGQSGE